MRKINYVLIAIAVLSISTFTNSQIDLAQSQSYTPRSVLAECQKCLDENVEQNRKINKHAVAIALVTALGCLVTGPGALMCAATVDVAVMGQMMVDISDGSGPECKAHYSACEAMWTALKQKVFTNCEVADTAPGSKLVKLSRYAEMGLGLQLGFHVLRPTPALPQRPPPAQICAAPCRTRAAESTVIRAGP